MSSPFSMIAEAEEEGIIPENEDKYIKEMPGQGFGASIASRSSYYLEEYADWCAADRKSRAEYPELYDNN